MIIWRACDSQILPGITQVRYYQGRYYTGQILPGKGQTRFTIHPITIPRLEPFSLIKPKTNNILYRNIKMYDVEVIYATQ